MQFIHGKYMTGLYQCILSVSYDSRRYHLNEVARAQYSHYRPSDRVRKKIENYPEIFGNIMRKKVAIMREKSQIMRKFPK